MHAVFRDTSPALGVLSMTARTYCVTLLVTASKVAIKTAGELNDSFLHEDAYCRVSYRVGVAVDDRGDWDDDNGCKFRPVAQMAEVLQQLLDKSSRITCHQC